MLEKDVAGGLTSILTPEVEDGRLLVKPESLPQIRNKVQQSFRVSPLDLPFHFANYAADLTGSAFEFSLAWFASSKSLSEIPHGAGEAVIMETGLIGSEWLFRHMGRWLKGVGYRPVCARLPYGVNWELIQKRSEILLETSEKEAKGVKVKWVVWSKGTLAAMVAIKKNPDKVSEYVDHIAFLGIPLECEINPVVSQIYLITQQVNRRVFGEDDFDFLDQLDLADGVKIPEGVGFTVIDSKNNGVSTFAEGNYAKTQFVCGTHSGLGFNFAVFKKIAESFAT